MCDFHAHDPLKDGKYCSSVANCRKYCRYDESDSDSEDYEYGGEFDVEDHG
jgi:hypothetical protein